jgi:CubicO group peptidase (beta-lactamase class C family)
VTERLTVADLLSHRSGLPRHDLAWLGPGAPPFELQPGRGLRFEVQGQPGVTAEFELDDTGAVARLVAQPIGIFLPKT